MALWFIFINLMAPSERRTYNIMKFEVRTPQVLVGTNETLTCSSSIYIHDNNTII